MNDADKLHFPFPTRDMLRFGKESRLQLRITSQSNQTNAVYVRCVTREGISEFRHAPANTGAASSENFSIADIPIFLCGNDTDSAYSQGQLYITVDLLIDGEVVYEFCAGMVYKQKGIAWPANNSEDARPGRGRVVMAVGSDPGAGVDVVITVPANRPWHFLGVHGTIINSATVATRRTYMQVTNTGGDVLFNLYSPDTTVASAEHEYYFFPWGNANVEQIAEQHYISIPPTMFLPADAVITISMISKQAGDDFGAPIYLYEEFYS